MKIIYTLSILLFVLQTFLVGQTSSLLKSVVENYETNNYDKAINISNNILLNKDSLTKKDLLKVYEIRAVCYYSKTKKDSSRISFIDALNLKESYQPNIQEVSPKIIEFFNAVKANYIKITSNNKTIPNTVKETNRNKFNPHFDKNHYIKTTALSLLAPGAGHLYNGYKTKGYVLLSASSLLLGSSIYYFFRTNDLEKKYIHSEKKLIEEKYAAYNKSYKVRNILLISYATVWLFSQLDLFFINPNQIELKLNNVDKTFSAVNNSFDVQLSINISF